MQNERRVFAFICGVVCSALASSLVNILICIGASIPVSAQEAVPGTEDPSVPAATVVPQQVRYTGKLTIRTGETVEAEFRIYAAAEGGDPLWAETQRVSVAEDGSYSVLLGGANPAGLPQTVFAGGAARWLGVSVERGAEQERLLLSSVPYAMKSADAESLAGHAASDFVTQEQFAESAQSSVPSGQKGTAVPELQPNTSGTVTGSGTAGTVPLWTGANAQGNSEITQFGSDIGINEATPAATLDVNGTAQFRGTLTLPAIATATSSSSSSSQFLNIAASVWSSTTNAPVSPGFQMFAYPVNNNTANPTAKFYMQYRLGSKVTDLFWVNTEGIIGFAPGQTFPGTITSVTGASPVTATTTSGAVSLGLNTTALETTLNSFYAQLSAANTFTKPITFASGQTFPGAGTITGVTAGTGLAGGGTSGSPKLAIDTTQVPLLNAENSFTNNNTFVGTLDSLGTLDIEANGVTSTFAPNLNSALLELSANAYNSTQELPEALKFGWQAVAAGGNTASPSANLELLYGTGSTQPTATGLSIAPNGIVNFASGQTFPGGGGGITGITTSSPLTGSGTSGTVNLSLNTSTLETTLNGVYAQLGAANTFTQPITFAASQSFPKTVGSITVSSPLTQSGTSGAVTLGLNSAALDSTFAQLGEPNIFTGDINAFSGSVNATTAGVAFKGTSTGGNYGVLGQSTVGSGVVGNAEAPGGGSAGVFGHTGNSFSGTSGTEAPSLVAGVWGDTTGNPISANNAAGVIGTADNAEGGSFFNNSASYAAVYAENRGSGTGISGTSDNGGIGVAGRGTTGVEGTSTASSGAGVYGIANTADAAGVSASASGEGSDGVYGIATGTYDSNLVPSIGVQGLATQFTGGIGVMGTSIGTSAVGKSLLGLGDVAGVWGDAAEGPNIGNYPNVGLTPNLTLGGVAGTADDNVAGFFENNSSNLDTLEVTNESFGGGGPTGLFRTFKAASPGGMCGFGGRGDLSCTGQVKALATSADGSHTVETYSVQSPENWMEDFGSGLLKQGVAVVKIDPAYAETVSETADYHVFLTPRGDSKGLYVINASIASFEVRESGGGTSSLSFDYRIVARRRGYEAQRLTDVTESFNRDKAETAKRLSVAANYKGVPQP
jgi:hypothetical protein